MNFNRLTTLIFRKYFLSNSLGSRCFAFCEGGQEVLLSPDIGKDLESVNNLLCE